MDAPSLKLLLVSVVAFAALGIVVLRARSQTKHKKAKKMETAIETETSVPTGSISVMDQTGDTKYSWNVKKFDEVQLAKEVFDLHKKKGYVPFSMEPGGAKGEQMTEFDPSAGHILFIPPLQGG